MSIAPTHPKEKCPECGEMVSTYPISWKSHMKKHMTVPQPEEAATSETLKPIPVVSTISPEKIKDPKAKEMYEMALAKQKELSKAPYTFASEMESDEHMEILKAYAPQCLGPHATHHAFIGDPRQESMYPQKGYMPLFDNEGNQIRDRGQPVYTIPLELHKLRERVAQKESRSRFQSSIRSDIDKLNKETSSSGVKAEVEELGVTNERL